MTLTYAVHSQAGRLNDVTVEGKCVKLLAQ